MLLRLLRAALSRRQEPPAGSAAAVTPANGMPAANGDAVYSFKSHQSWGITNPERFREVMDEAVSLVEPGSYLGDNLFTWMRNLSAADDTAFQEAWRSNIANPSDEAIMWRRYILCCAAFHCRHLEGHFVECGVLFGTGVKTVIDYFGRDRFAKPFWAYDTFDTNPVQGHAFPGQREGLYEQVRARFSGYDDVRLIRGLLPDALRANSPQGIAYLHIDLNSAEYEVAVLDQLFDRVVSGGIVILDDYEWSGVYRAQKIAEDAWFAQRNYRVFPLPTGQGLILKR